MNITDYDYVLPETAIARFPLSSRSASRLLLLDRQSGDVRDRQFTDIASQLNAGDCLVLNDTKVIPARWFGRKQSGGQIECFLERITHPEPYPRALVHLRASKAPKLGSNVILNGDIEAVVMAKTASGLYEIQFNTHESLLVLLDAHAEMPLPPYLTRQPEDLDDDRYQTVFANLPGAVAAPTAGLHFDDAILQACRDKGVHIATLTLHVGAGTFQPVRVDDIRQHKMHAERYQVSQTACDTINACKAAGGRVIAVGTTVVRTLETLAQQQGASLLQPAEGESQLFIYPGFDFLVIDAMLTNFHLPRSSLLMLVSAFASRESVMHAYQHAVSTGYRFFSYGDAMLIASF